MEGRTGEHPPPFVSSLGGGGKHFPLVLLGVLAARHSIISGKRTFPIIFLADGKTTKSSLKTAFRCTAQGYVRASPSGNTGQ